MQQSSELYNYSGDPKHARLNFGSNVFKMMQRTSRIFLFDGIMQAYKYKVLDLNISQHQRASMTSWTKMIENINVILLDSVEYTVRYYTLRLDFSNIYIYILLLDNAFLKNKASYSSMSRPITLLSKDY